MGQHHSLSTSISLATGPAEATIHTSCGDRQSCPPTNINGDSGTPATPSTTPPNTTSLATITTANPDASATAAPTTTTQTTIPATSSSGTSMPTPTNSTAQTQTSRTIVESFTTSDTIIVTFSTTALSMPPNAVANDTAEVSIGKSLGSPASQTSSSPADTESDANNEGNDFMHNKKAVAGTFTAVSLVIIALAIAVLVWWWKRGARRRKREAWQTDTLVATFEGKRRVSSTKTLSPSLDQAYAGLGKEF